MKIEDLFSLSGKVAFVTGAAGGLGLIQAEGLAEARATVVLSDIKEEKLMNVKENLKKKGLRVDALKCDVTNEDEVKRAVEKVVSKYGHIDILVNNAGVTYASPTTEYSLRDWEKVLRVNLTGIFLCSREASKYMIKQRRGKIINISSVYGLMADISPELPYYTSKAGVIGLTRQLALELSPYNINVNAIAPGFFPTEMTKPFIEDLDALSCTLSKIPFKRVGMPDELKGTVIFLASRASDCITGQVIVVDGGWTIW